MMFLWVLLLYLHVILPEKLVFPLVCLFALQQKSTMPQHQNNNNNNKKAGTFHQLFKK